jgi:hypothetical protein
MNDRSLVEIFWALAVISLPVCILIFTIIFKKEISQLLERIGRKDLIKEKYHTTSKSNKSHTDKIDHIENESKVQINEQHQKIENNFILVDVCQNQNSGKYFIVIDENTNDMATMIIPDGNIKNLELKLFNNFAQKNINELFDKNLVTNEQLTTYFNYIENDANNYLEECDSGIIGVKHGLSSRGEEPNYLKSYRNMLRNPDTWPSRMLKMIKKEKKITKKQLKEKIAIKYNYAKSDTNGSFHASLRLLLVDGYISAEGIGDNKIVMINHD